MKRVLLYINFATLIFFIIFLIYPSIFILRQALFVNDSFTLRFVIELFSQRESLSLLLNSINLAISATFMASLISVPLAILMTRFKFKGKGLLQALLVFPMILPPFVGAIGLRRMLSRFGPINLLLIDSGIIKEQFDFLGSGGLFAIALTQALHLYPILYLNICAGLASLNPTLLEAAQNVGARPLRSLFRITLPLIAPSFFAGASIVFLWSFTDLGTPLVFYADKLLPVVIFNMRDQIYENPAGYALVLFMLVVSALIFIAGKSFIKGNQDDQGSKGISQVAELSLTKWQCLLVYIPILAFSILTLLPHIGVFLLSVSDKWFMSVIPQKFTIASYFQVAIHPITITSIKNSFILSLSSTVVGIFLGLTISYTVNRSSFIFRSLLDLLSMLPIAIPGVVLAFGYLGAFSGSFLSPRLNPFPLLIIGYALRRLPFSVRTISAGFEQASLSLEEAAQSVGAKPMRVLSRITLPLLFPSIAASAILCFSFAMLEVSESLLLAMETRYYPITKGMYSLLARPDGLQIASALGVLSMILIWLSLWLASKVARKDIAEIFKV